MTLGLCLVLLFVHWAPTNAADQDIDNGLPETPTVVVLTVRNQTSGTVSDELFGQMMERVGKHGEQGPEVILKEDGTFRQDIVELLRDMEIPLVRFPGGFRVEFDDWTTLIDNAPGHEEPRPSDRRFGYDEFFRLAEELGWEVIIPLNLAAAALDWRKPDDVALNYCSGLLAYLAAPVGANLPDGMPDWPTIRAQNGHPEPYRIKYIQLGNEWESYWKNIEKEIDGVGARERVAKMRRILLAMLDRIEKFTPDAKIITDGVVWSDKHLAEMSFLYEDGMVRKRADYLAHHVYRPWIIDEIRYQDEKVPITDIPEEDVWYAVVSAPEMNEDGFSCLRGSRDWTWTLADKQEWAIAMTEWNWNGWGQGDRITNSEWAQGMGAAGFIHAMLRDCNRIHLATQSMLIGTKWGIAGIHVSEDGKGEARMRPTAKVTTLYRKHHGNRLLTVQSAGIRERSVPVQLGRLLPKDTVALMDPIATANDETLFVHLIQRDFVAAQEVVIRFDGFETDDQAQWLLVEGDLDLGDAGKEKDGGISISDRTVPLDGGEARVSVPPRTISILAIPLK